jgi:hypothetical protein
MKFTTYCTHLSEDSALKCLAYKYGCGEDILAEVRAEHVTSMNFCLEMKRRGFEYNLDKGCGIFDAPKPEQAALEGGDVPDEDEIK